MGRIDNEDERKDAYDYEVNDYNEEEAEDYKEQFHDYDEEGLQMREYATYLEDVAEYGGNPMTQEEFEAVLIEELEVK